jgi:hypothetical protein
MMNERIDELAFQSGITQHSYSNPKHPDLDGFIVSQEKLEKFAELIVRECIAVLNNRFMGDMNREDLEVRRCIADVKQHFGVEE